LASFLYNLISHLLLRETEKKYGFKAAKYVLNTQRDSECTTTHRPTLNPVGQRDIETYRRKGGRLKQDKNKTVT